MSDHSIRIHMTPDEQGWAVHIEHCSCKETGILVSGLVNAISGVLNCTPSVMTTRLKSASVQ